MARRLPEMTGERIPPISILMPLRDSAATLPHAMESIVRLNTADSSFGYGTRTLAVHEEGLDLST